MADVSTQEKNNTIDQYLKDKSWVDRPEVLPWYIKDLINLEPKTKELFEIYSKVPPDEVVFHITQIRNKAFKIVSMHPRIFRVKADATTSSRTRVLATGDFST